MTMQMEGMFFTLLTVALTVAMGGAILYYFYDLVLRIRNRRRHSISTTQGSTPQVHAAKPIWNPNAAANWSLLFTPAFGSYLHMLNWESLGESERAADSKKWFYASIVMLTLFVLAGVLFPADKSVDGIVRASAGLFLITWYFVSARPQARYVKEKFADDYPHRPWKRALLYALGVWFGYLVLMVLIGIVIGAIHRT